MNHYGQPACPLPEQHWSNDDRQFYNWIPAEVRARIDALPPGECFEEYRRWRWHWIRSGARQESIRHPSLFPFDHDNHMPPWESARVRANPDVSIRTLQSRWERSQDPSDEIRWLAALARSGRAKPWELARFRQLDGQAVEPWEVSPLSYLFLKAAEWHEPYREKARGRMTDPPAPRLEAQRKLYQDSPMSDPKLAISFELRDPETYMLVADPGDWKPGTRPDQIAMEPLGYPDRTDGIFPSKDVPLERFYVSPSSYPCYRGQEDLDRILSSRTYSRFLEVELEIHRTALDWFVKKGAIRYTLDDRSWPRQGPPAIRERVLVALPDIRDVATYSQRFLVDRRRSIHEPGYPDHNSRILFPKLWAKARFMTRKGKRWKNNPGRSR